jgi:hypothetical protein
MRQSPLVNCQSALECNKGQTLVVRTASLDDKHDSLNGVSVLTVPRVSTFMNMRTPDVVAETALPEPTGGAFFYACALVRLDTQNV